MEGTLRFVELNRRYAFSGSTSWAFSFLTLPTALATFHSVMRSAGNGLSNAGIAARFTGSSPGQLAQSSPPGDTDMRSFSRASTALATHVTVGDGPHGR